MTALARQRFSDQGKSNRRHSGHASSGGAQGHPSTVLRLKSWFGARALGVMGVGGMELTDVLANLESASPVRG